MVGYYVPHVVQELFVVVDQRTWSCVKRVAIPSNQFWNAHLVMHHLMFRTRSRCPAGKGHVQGNSLERAMNEHVLREGLMRPRLSLVESTTDQEHFSI